MMKKLWLVLVIGTSLNLQASSFFDGFIGNKKQTSELQVTVGDKKDQDLERIKAKLLEFERGEDAFSQDIQVRIDRAKQKVVTLEQLPMQDAASLVPQLLVTTKATLQTLTTIKTVHKELGQIYKETVTLLEGYVKDPQFDGLLPEKKSLYGFQELQSLSYKVGTQEDKVRTLKAELLEVKTDTESLKKKLLQAEKVVQDKLKEQAEFGKTSIGYDGDVYTQSEILDAQVVLAEYEKQLLQTKIQEKEARSLFLTERLLIEDKKRTLLTQERDLIIRVSFRVDQKDVAAAQQEFSKEQQVVVGLTDRFVQKIETLTGYIETLKREIITLDSKGAVKDSDVAAVRDWNLEPTSGDTYAVVAHIGFLNEQIASAEREIDLYRAQIELAKFRLKEKALVYNVVQTWYKLKQQELHGTDSLQEEIKKYQEVALELKREKTLFEDKRTAAANKLSGQNRSLNLVRERLEQVKNKRLSLFPRQDQLYVQTITFLERAQGFIARQTDATGKLIEVYSQALLTIANSLKQADGITSELNRVSLWHRAGGAISLEGIRNIIPDIHMFVLDLKVTIQAYVQSLLSGWLSYRLANFLSSPWAVMFFCLKLLAVIVLFFIVRSYLPSLAYLLLQVQQEYRGAFYSSRVAYVLCIFASKHLVTLFIWAFLFWHFGSTSPAELYLPSILFFLLSIPYLLYLAQRLNALFRAYNKEQDYLLLSESFEKRFFTVLNWLLYSTIILLCFREALMLGLYTKSELPNILLAIYSIIIRVLLLALIRKEDLLAVIPTRSVWGNWVWHIVNDYYHLLLVVIILLMALTDSHIGGYNNLVSYLLWGSLGSIVAARLLFLFYGFARRLLAALFFSSDGESLQERFSSAKSWYGASVIALVALCIILGIGLISWFWQKPIHIATMYDYLTLKRLVIGLKDGQYQKLSIVEVASTITVLPLSFFVAYLIDKYLLFRIYAVLLVDPGVHNAVSTISYYLVVISTITLGLWYQGFGFLIAYYLTPLILGMAWALRDIFNDFVGYFILLINRPIKVGDYIMLDEEVKGVVRKITPRTVVLRRKRSYSLIIPNSRFMRDTILNWDYTPGYITFPDIEIGIRYADDPEKTVEVLKKAIDSVPNVLKMPIPVIRLEEFGPSGYVFLVRGFISSEKTLDQWDIASDVRRAITKFLKQHEISIAFPVRVVRTAQEERHYYSASQHSVQSLQDKFNNDDDGGTPRGFGDAS